MWLPSGGSLVIDRTEAMTVVDVNTGKFVGSGGNLEQTVTRNNLEAAEEIVRQLRLRDIGGIIVIDFIDMVLESNRDLVLRRLTECLGRDRTKHQVAEVTSLGLVQMTRKRVGQGLLEVVLRAVRALPRPRRDRLDRPGRREAPQRRHRRAAAATAAAAGGGSRRERSGGPRDVKDGRQQGRRRRAGRGGRCPAEPAAEDGEPTEGARTGSRRNRGRRGRGQSGEDRAAEDAAVARRRAGRRRARHRGARHDGAAPPSTPRAEADGVDEPPPTSPGAGDGRRAPPRRSRPATRRRRRRPRPPSRPPVAGRPARQPAPRRRPRRRRAASRPAGPPV